jgi:hypothetical protein
MIKIIEDCSPFYIRFTHDGIEDLISLCSSFLPPIEELPTPYTHLKLPINQAEQILDAVPLSKYLTFNKSRVSAFISKEGLYYRAHKDGINHRFSINYSIKVSDDKCVTSWYSDEDCKNYDIDILYHKKGPLHKMGSSRECENFDKSKHTPIKQMTAHPLECTLFNTDIFHDWDNSKSTNSRAILTLRAAAETVGYIYFEDVQKILYAMQMRD